jgi:hypothetical protein
MAYCSCLLSFAYSKWNSEVNDESKIVILEQLHLNDHEPKLKDYRTVLCTQDIFLLTDTTETSDDFIENCSMNTKVSDINYTFDIKNLTFHV